MSWFHRAKDRQKLHQDLVERGHTPPHHDDEEAFSTYLNTVMTPELHSEMSSHFDPSPPSESAPSFDSAPSVDTFDAGGGSSGGGGGDGSW